MQQVRSNLPADLPQLDASTLARLKQQALDAAKQLQQQVQDHVLRASMPMTAIAGPISAAPMFHAAASPQFISRRGAWCKMLTCCLANGSRWFEQAVQTAAASAQHASAVAQDVAASKSAKEAGTKLWVAWRHIDSSAWFAKLARALVGGPPLDVLQGC